MHIELVVTKEEKKLMWYFTLECIIFHFLLLTTYFAVELQLFDKKSTSFQIFSFEAELLLVMLMK